MTRTRPFLFAGRIILSILVIITLALLVLSGCLPADNDDDLSNPVTTLTRRIIALIDPEDDSREIDIVAGEAHEIFPVSGVPEPAGADSRSLAYWWLFADPQLIDEENPTRLGFFDSKTILGGMFDAAYRPQEDISPHLLNASVMTANGIMKKFGRNFDLALGLGDNADNASLVEMRWLIDILDGTGEAGMIRPDTGDLDIVGGFNRGARNFGTQEAYNPYSRLDMPNSNADFYAPGLRTPLGTAVPWFAVIGNHDALHTGNFPVDGSPIADPLFNNFFFDADAFVSDISSFGYLLGLPNLVVDTLNLQGPPREFYSMIGGPFIGGLLSNPFFIFFLALFGSNGINTIENEIDPNFDFLQLIPDPFDPPADTIGIPITPDALRAFAGTAGYINALRESEHGFSLESGPCASVFPEGIDPDKGYFSTDAPTASASSIPLRLIFLNTAEYPLAAEGGITATQWAWLECQLQQAADENKLIVVVSHHPTADLVKVVTQKDNDTTICSNTKACQEAFTAMLQSVPHVIAHLVGHGHNNEIIYHQADSAANSYWEIQTASIIDWPQQTRILEIVAYQNGVGEIWSTMVDHALVSPSADHNTLTKHARLLAVGDVELGSDGYFGGENSPDDRNRILRFIIPPGVMAYIPPGDGEITSRDVLPYVE